MVLLQQHDNATDNISVAVPSVGAWFSNDVMKCKLSFFLVAVPSVGAWFSYFLIFSAFVLCAVAVPSVGAWFSYLLLPIFTSIL